MEKIVASLQSRPKSATRLTRNSKLFKVILEAIASKKGGATASLDLRKIDEAVADFFVITEADSYTQIRAIADAVEEEVKNTLGERPYHREDGEQWTLLDYVNIVVHILTPEHRKFYDLDSLWADAGRTEHLDTGKQ